MWYIELDIGFTDSLHFYNTVICSYLYILKCNNTWFYFMIKTQIIMTYLICHVMQIPIYVHIITRYIVYDWMSCHVPFWYYIYCIAYLVRDWMLSPVSLLSHVVRTTLYIYVFIKRSPDYK
jgi:hypothetical protein